MSRTISNSGSIAFASGDDLTTEKKTDAFYLSVPSNRHGDVWALYVDKPAEDTAGNLTVKCYDVKAVDGTNSRDVPVATFTVEKATGAATQSRFLIRAWGGIGPSQVKVGMKFAADSGAITVSYLIKRFSS